MLSGHIGPVISICYFPDKEKIISVSLDNTLKVWNSSMRNNIKKRLINQS
jgi:WD40 repeat protein